MAVLVQHNLTSGYAPSTEATNIVGGTIINGSMSDFANESLGYTSDPVLRVNPTTGSTSAALAITNDNYFSFSIGADAGFSYSLTSLTFNVARGGAGTPRGYDVRSSADSYATTLGTADVATARTTWTAVSIDLTGAAFQSVTDTITFRIYAYAPSNANSVEFDDFIINGTTASAGTVEQEGFLFRADDGSETTATALAAQDTNIIRPIETPTRLRVLLNGTLDKGSENYQLEYRRVGDSTWSVIT